MTEVLIRGERGCLFNFSQIVVRYDSFSLRDIMCQYLRSLIRMEKNNAI